MDGAIEKSAMRKVYMRLLPFAILSYFLAYIDRINVSFAGLTMRGDLDILPLRRRNRDLVQAADKSTPTTPGTALREGHVEGDGFGNRYLEAGRGPVLVHLHGAGIYFRTADFFGDADFFRGTAFGAKGGSSEIAAFGVECDV
jgi:hypothetical protein